MNLAEKYLAEALDNYPYQLRATMEALDYALSYDEENALAYCLYGEIYSDCMGNPVLGIEYFEYALSIDPNTCRVYWPYISALISIEDYAKAHKVIDYAMKVKGVDKTLLWTNKALIEELALNFDAAMEHLSAAKNFAIYAHLMAYITEIETRLKSKMPKEEEKVEDKEEEPKSKLKLASWFGTLF